MDEKFFNLSVVSKEDGTKVFLVHSLTPNGAKVAFLGSFSELTEYLATL